MLDYLINLKDYTVTEFVIFATGCYMWAVAYGIIIYNIRKHRIVEMPTIAGCGNFGWEFLWSFFFITNMGAICLWAYRAWFFLDIFIFWSILKYGDQEVFIPIVRRRFRRLALVALGSWIVLFYFFGKQGFDTPIGANSAYILNLVISVSYPFMILQAPSLKGISWWVAWLKMIGTGLNTVFNFMHYPDNHFLQTLGVLCFVADSIYIWCFWMRKTNRLQAPETIAAI